MSKPTKVAAIQIASVAFDLSATLSKAKKFLQEAVSNGADLVVFPEAFLSAYPRDYNFGAIIGSRSDEGRAWFGKYHASSVEVGSAAFDALSEMTREAGVVVQYGVIERDGGTLYCATLLFGKDGALLARHRKLIPTAAERIVWGRGAGDELKVAKTEVGKLGSLICWENYMPAARMALYSQGVEIYLAPTADARPVWTSTMQHIALEGRCFVVGVNQFCRISDYPEDYPPHLENWELGEQDQVVCRGGSVIVDPFGKIIAGPLWDQEGVLYAECDLGMIAGAKMDFDPVGSYARPDIFTLKVNTKPGDQVIFE